MSGADSAPLRRPPPAREHWPLVITGIFSLMRAEHHGERVLTYRHAQMRNCMKVGNVVAGVICADGHLGYAQPVGSTPRSRL